MSLNMDKIKNKLASLIKGAKSENQSKKSPETIEKIKKYIWKPEPGKQVIRIVPYKFSPDYPFTELKFHFQLNGETYLSPATINQQDPIVEFANVLQKNRDTWKKGKDLQPKVRTYVPVVVRGKEEEGIKFWGFGSRVYEQLISYINEPDYGDITDIVNGHDIQVDYITKEESKTDFPETKLLIKPKSRPVIDPEQPNAKGLLDLIINQQPNLFEIYIPATYDELKEAMDLKLENERNGIVSSNNNFGYKTQTSPAVVNKPATTYSKKESVLDDDDDTIPMDNKPVVASVTTSPSLEKSKTASPSVEDFDEVFKNLFAAKK